LGIQKKGIILYIILRYGLCWNEKKAGHLLSCGYDSKILLWNVEAPNIEKNACVAPMSEFLGHKGAVEDVCWHKFHPEIFGSCGDDRQVLMYYNYYNIISWDTRKP
jgi:histone-binding protein RBBP4